MLVPKFLDKIFHLGVERFGIQSLIDPGAMVRRNGIPIQAVEFRVELHFIDLSDQFIQDSQLHFFRQRRDIDLRHRRDRAGCLCGNNSTHRREALNSPCQQAA